MRFSNELENVPSDSEIIKQFNELFEITPEGLGVVEINGHKIEISGWMEVKSTKLNPISDIPISFELEETMVVIIQSDNDSNSNDTEKLVMDANSRNKDLYAIFNQKFPYLRNERHLTSLLLEFCKTLPEFKMSSARSLYTAVLDNHFLPLERKRLEIINTDPSKLDYGDLKLRQELYVYTKNLAQAAGKTEQEFLADIEKGTTEEKFLGGQWLIRSEYYGTPMIVVSKTVERENEEIDPSNPYTYRAVWIQEPEVAEETICKKADDLGYTVDRQDDMSWHNYKYEIGIVIPDFDISTAESKLRTIQKIKTMTLELGLAEHYCKPDPIIESGGAEKYRYRRYFDRRE